MRSEFLQKGRGLDMGSGLHVLLESIVNSFPEAIGAESSEITLYSSSNKSFLFAASTGDKDRIFAGREFRPAPGDGDKIITQRVMESKNPLVLDQAREHSLSRSDREMIDKLGIQSIAVFPLLAGGKFLGSISFDFIEHSHRYSRQELNAMHSLADLAALMIGYAEQMQTE